MHSLSLSDRFARDFLFYSLHRVKCLFCVREHVIYYKNLRNSVLNKTKKFISVSCKRGPEVYRPGLDVSTLPSSGTLS